MPTRTRRHPFADIHPLRAFELIAGFEDTIPDIIEFVMSDRYLNRPNLYPRQATVLKTVFLQEELFTQYDYDVLGEWGEAYTASMDERGEGNNGIVPDILERLRINKGDGRRWFRECVLAMGRRGSKGHMGGLAGAYVLWNFLAKGDPQGHYGVDRDKQLGCQVFAGKKEQARAHQWKDLTNVILGSTCFAPYISRPLGESLSVYAPYDFVRMMEREARGIDVETDMASFIIEARESTTMAARGPASFMQFYDEMAHVVRQVAKNDASEVYECLDGESRVLGADLIWRPIKSLKVGDALVSVDEYPEPNGKRCLREAKVLGIATNRQRPYKLTFDDGSEIICSGNHRWLHHQSAKWGQTKRLRVGSRLRALADPWRQDDSREAGYLAGFYDGEGFVVAASRTYGVGFSQNAGSVLDGVKELLDSYGFAWRAHRQNACQQVFIKGIAEGMRFLGQIRPQRLLERQKLLWEGRSPGGRFKTIVKIERMPEQELWDIETSTGTFIAEGLVSHNSATPSLDQFGKDAFLWEPSSPWQRMGQFYENYQKALAKEEDGSPTYPEVFMLQLASWDIYVDWERTTDPALRLPAREERVVPVPNMESFERRTAVFFPRLRGAIQTFDADMEKLERANPETFRVERRAHFAAVLDAYLNPDRIAAMWKPWPTEDSPMVMKSDGPLSIDYRAHGDPSKSGANFGFAIAHVEYPPEEIDDRGLPHVIFDVIHSWTPGDFTENNLEIDYDVIEEDLKGYLDAFKPVEMTFDQYPMGSTIKHLRDHIRRAHYPKGVVVYERPATGPLNWATYEAFKTALGLGLIHAPYHELADLELQFLQDLGTNKVDHPTAGPVQTKDVADCLAICTYELIGSDIAAFVGKTLAELPIGTAAPGGLPHAITQQREETHEQLSAFNRRRRAIGATRRSRG